MNEEGAPRGAFFVSSDSLAAAASSVGVLTDYARCLSSSSRKASCGSGLLNR